MAKKKAKKKKAAKKSRTYWRSRGGESRAYGDFRDLGGGREALIPKGEKVATTDPDIADKLIADRVAELEGRKRSKAILGLEGRETLPRFADFHLAEKSKDPDLTDRTIATAERHLKEAADFFGPDTLLDEIDVADVEAWRDHLAATRTRTGRLMSPGTQRHHLNDLSNLYRRAQARKVVPLGYNPVSLMMEKPSAATAGEAKWIEVHDAALLLESARTWTPPRPGVNNADMHTVLATFMLTGGRKSEVLGLAVEDVSFTRNTVTFRPNQYRRLKTRTSPRVVPLWPQLRTILRDHLLGRDEAAGGLLFPGPGGGEVTDFRKSLDAIATRAGFAPGEVSSKALRHTYISARLQTVDQGAPVSAFTVANEAGHGGLRLVERIYGHLGEVRHRSEVVEYRVENHRDALGNSRTRRGRSSTTSR